MRDSSSAATLAPLAVVARWQSVAVMVVLPMVLAGWLAAGVLAFGLFEMGLATVQRRDQFRRDPRRVTVPVEARQAA